MKGIALAGTTLVLIMTTCSALAAENSLNTGTFGLNVDTYNHTTINGKYFIAKDMAVIGGLGLNLNSGANNGNDISFIAGVRKYLKTDDFSPFVGGRFEYSSTNNSNTSNWGLTAEAGAEYFIAKHFSLEGRVGFGYTSQDVKNPVTGVTTNSTVLGTTAFGLGANFYF
jgi:hypothetical protein